MLNLNCSLNSYGSISFVLSMLFLLLIFLHLFPSLSFPVSRLLNVFLIPPVLGIHPQRVSLNLHFAA